ncbi:MAG TPA: hypothetical protein VFZ01_10305, partial [Geminicoccaceae bacterium]
VGRTVPEAFLRLYRLERACQVQLDAAAAGRLHVVPDDVARKSGDDVERFASMQGSYGELEFQALMRRLDRIDPTYRN